MKISFLCDRKTTVISKTQHGFIRFAPLPLYKALARVLPACQPVGTVVERLEKSAKAWEERGDETEEEKRIYSQITNGKLDASWK